MSMSEYAQIMKEAGLIRSDRGGSDKIQVEHVFVFDVTEKWEKVVKGIALGCLDLGRHVVNSLRIIAVAGSIGILLWGTSQLVASFRKSTKVITGSQGSKQ
jgi:hypothetical protein